MTLRFTEFVPSAKAASSPALTVRLYNYAQVPHSILISAEHDANRILSDARSEIVWLDCLKTPLALADKRLCDSGWSEEVPSVRILSGEATRQFHHLEYGFSAVPVLVTVSYDRILIRAARDNAPSEASTLLGCVMAHELGHLLLGGDSHFPAGIMQPVWGSEQVRQAKMGNLRFTAKQAELLRNKISLLAARRLP